MVCVGGRACQRDRKKKKKEGGDGEHRSPISLPPPKHNNSQGTALHKDPWAFQPYP